MGKTVIILLMAVALLTSLAAGAVTAWTNPVAAAPLIAAASASLLQAVDRLHGSVREDVESARDADRSGPHPR